MTRPPSISREMPPAALRALPFIAQEAAAAVRTLRTDDVGLQTEKSRTRATSLRLTLVTAATLIV